MDHESVSERDRGRFLRLSLRGNALFSSLSGLTFVLASGTIARFLGDYPASLVFGVGAQLLLFAGALVWLSSRPEIPTPLAIGVIVADLFWVVATGVVVYAGWLTRQGDLLVLALADVVLVLAILQSFGVRRKNLAWAEVES